MSYSLFSPPCQTKDIAPHDRENKYFIGLPVVATLMIISVINTNNAKTQPIRIKVPATSQKPENKIFAQSTTDVKSIICSSSTKSAQTEGIKKGDKTVINNNTNSITTLATPANTQIIFLIKYDI